MLFIFSCRKEPTVVQQSLTQIPTIKIEDAKNWFVQEQRKLQNQASLSPTDGYILQTVNPKWDDYHFGFTDIGKEFLIVPIIDTANSKVPNNRNRLLLITKDSMGNSLTGHSLIYIPYKQYNKLKVGDFNLDDFSGAFIYTDAIGHFIQGKRVSNGKCLNYLRLNIPNVAQVRCGGYVNTGDYV